MKRLTKRYPNGNVTLDAEQFGIDQNTLDGEINSSEPIAAAVKRLAEFENAEEKGLLVHLPCKVGDTVYVVDGKHIVECKVYNITTNIHMDNKHESEYYWKGFEIKNNEFGKTVFFSPEEAQQALKARTDNE